MHDPLTVPSYITDQPPKGMGVPAKRVEQVCKNPDEKHLIEYDDLSARILVKHGISSSDLVILQIAPKRQAVFAGRLLPDLSDVPLQTLSPLKLLKDFVTRFGLVLEVGSFEGLLLYNEKIPLDGAQLNQVLNIRNPENHAFTSSQFIKVTPDGVADVALAFVIDVTMYDQWHNA